MEDMNMIRDYTKTDIDEIIKIYTLEYKAMPEEIETLKSAPKILVYDDNGIKGFIHLIMGGNHCYVEMGVESNERIRDIGLKLWEAAEILFKENSITSITTFHVKDNLKWMKIFDEIGFEYWYSVYRLKYEGAKFDEPDISVVRYEDRYYEDTVRLESEAFSTLRKGLDIKPYNWYLSASKEEIENKRKAALKGKEYIYLFFEEDEIVGSSVVKNAEVELLYTNVKYQGKGYGKKILEYTVNRGLEQNAGGVNLNALASNEKALRLYGNAGFKLVQAQDCRRMVL